MRSALITTPILALVVAFPTSSMSVGPRPCDKAVDVAADTTIDAMAKPRSPLITMRVRRGPAYPPELRNRGIEGEAHVTFVFDTTGRVVRGSANILTESHREFGTAVCEFLRRASFAPALVDGRRLSVRVVDMGFKFALGQRPNE